MISRIPAASGEDGYTLIEVMIAVAILGIVFVGLLGALMTIIIGSDVHRQQADANTVLVSAAEKLKDESVAYQSCAEATNAVYLTAARSATMPEGWSATAAVSIEDVQYWDGTEFQDTCLDGTEILRLQLIELKVVSPDGEADERLAIVKREI